MARDCTTKKDPNGFVPNPAMGGTIRPPTGGPGVGGGSKGFDSEYASLMAELGEGGGGGGGDHKAPWARNDIGGDSNLPVGTSIPPWRRPEVWQQPNLNQPQGGQGNQGYRPPQPQGGYAGYGQQGAGYGAQGGGGGYGASAWAQAGYGGGGGAAAGFAGQQGYGTADPSAYAQYYQSLNYQQQQLPSH